MKLTLLYLLASIGAVFCLITKTNLLITTFILFGIPCIYLTYILKNKQIIPRLLIAAFLGSCMLAILVDYLGFLNHAWYVINTVFGFRLFSVVPIEDPVWSFSWIYLILVFYESYFKTGNKSLLGKRAKYWFLMNALAFSIFFISIILNPVLLSSIPYYYLVFGIFLALLPMLLFLKFYPKYISPFIKVACYVSVVSFIDEIVALKLNHWTFYGGKFLMMIKIWGVNLPFEELFFFILIGSIFTLCYYEFFDGDKT